MKEQNKTLAKELSKMETSNLLDAGFKTLVRGCLMNLVSTSKHQSEKGPVRNEEYTN